MIVDNGKYYLYRHIRLDKNEPFYIGIGTKLKNSLNKNTIYKRSCDSIKRRNKIWNCITSKTEYKVEILFESNDYEFIKSKEIEFIKLYGRIDLKTGTLANLTDGGEGCLNKIVSLETKNKISKKNKGKVRTEKQIKSIRDRSILAIINKDTKEIFESITDAALSAKLSLPVFYYRLNSEVFKFNYEYLEKPNKIKREPKIGKVGVKIQNLKTNEIFNTITEAANYENIDKYKFYSLIKKKNSDYKRLE